MGFINFFKQTREILTNKTIEEQYNRIEELEHVNDELRAYIRRLEKSNQRLQIKLQNVEDFISEYDKKEYRIWAEVFVNRLKLN